jgi:hypothetical protein
MATQSGERRLAAIMFTDIAGSTALTAGDEGTASAWPPSTNGSATPSRPSFTWKKCDPEPRPRVDQARANRRRLAVKARAGFARATLRASR